MITAHVTSTVSSFTWSIMLNDIFESEFSSNETLFDITWQFRNKEHLCTAPGIPGLLVRIVWFLRSDQYWCHGQFLYLIQLVLLWPFPTGSLQIFFHGRMGGICHQGRDEVMWDSFWWRPLKINMLECFIWQKWTQHPRLTVHAIS